MLRRLEFFFTRTKTRISLSACPTRKPSQRPNAMSIALHWRVLQPPPWAIAPHRDRITPKDQRLHEDSHQHQQMPTPSAGSVGSSVRVEGGSQIRLEDYSERCVHAVPALFPGRKATSPPLEPASVEDLTTECILP